jgi:RNA polymerase sigma-70 factor (ECF subfamily)
MADDSHRHKTDVRLHLVVLRCQAGDEQAFRRLMEEFGPRTLGHLRSLIGDDAEDVQQDVWLTVYRHIASLANPGAFKTWLFSTTRHRAIDFLRRRKREQELVDEFALVTAVTTDIADDLDDDGIDEALLSAALADLPPTQREVLLLRYRDGMSYSEIAVVVGCPLGTVRTRLHHAKRQLHQRLKEVTHEAGTVDRR